MGLKLKPKKTKEEKEAAKKAKAAALKSAVADRVEKKKDEADELPPAGHKVDLEDVTYAGTGDQLFYVTLEKAGHAAVVYGESDGDAKDTFLQLFGIVGTEHPLKAAKVDEDHGYNLDKNGVVVPMPKKKKRRSDREGDDRDDD